MLKSNEIFPKILRFDFFFDFLLLIYGEVSHIVSCASLRYHQKNYRYGKYKKEEPPKTGPKEFLMIHLNEYWSFLRSFKKLQDVD